MTAFSMERGENMFADFSFNGVGNDEYGVMCVSFESSSKQTYSGQTTKLNTQLAGDGREFEIYDQKYSEPMTFSFQIINKNGKNIEQEQERHLNKWLCHKGEYSWMFIQEPRYADIYFRAVISNPKIIVISDVVGLEYTVTTSAATCFSDEYDSYVSLTRTDNWFELYLFNDDECIIYPQLEVTIREAGDFRLQNSAEDDETVYMEIKGVSVGEIISVDCELPFISSSTSHDVWNSFNKFWFRLYDGYNRITANLACSINIKYRETRRLIVF